MISTRRIRIPLIVLTALAIPLCVRSQVPTIAKVEPPSWWANHSINPVRILIRGTNLHGAIITENSGGITFSNIRVNTNGTYVFVSAWLSARLKPGRYPLKLTTPKGTIAFNFEVNPSLTPGKNFQGINTDDVIYLIMIDRFANGDPKNDQPAGAAAETNDRSNPRTYHGGDFRGIIDHLPYLKELGVTALWLTPWYDNWNGMNTCDHPWCPNTYYHGYHAIDYYGVEDHFGDLNTLRDLVQKAHALNIKVIQDQVANHVGSRHPWVTDPPLPDWFHGTLAQHQRNRFRNYTLLSPHSNPDDFRNTLDGWFSDDLPDMNQEEPEVAKYEIQNSLWWVGTTGIDGIRQDTIQYMPRFFIHDLSDALHRQYSKMWMVGEVFERDAAQTAFFIGGHRGWDGLDTKLDSVFDFSLWNVSQRVFTNKLPMRALPYQLKYDALYPDPLKLTTLANNHDTMRFMSLEGATLEGAMMHIAFTLSVRGIPQLYSGEELAMEGKDDPDNRRDFPGGFPFGNSPDTRSAFTREGRHPDEQRMFEWTRQWIRLRLEHSAIRDGRLIDLYEDDDAYVFARQSNIETIVVAFNRLNEAQKIKVPMRSIHIRDGADLKAILGSPQTARVVDGQVTVTIPARTAVAFRAN
ncbi:MAG TPA: alpha-amylase family glycosyl hydrolase [Pyrinomonadaceae bacterium]